MSKGIGVQEFIDDSKKGYSEFVDWREDGKITGFVHLDGFFLRKVYFLPVETEIKKKGKIVKEVGKEAVVCAGLEGGCPLCELRQHLKNSDEIDNDDTIFVFGAGKDKQEYLKGDVLGLKGYTWNKSMRPTKEHLFGFVDVDNVEGGVIIVTARPGLQKAISKTIVNRMEKKGPEEGDPFKNPYALHLTYNKDSASPNDVYDAFYDESELTAEIQELLDGEGPNVEELITPGNPAETWALIKDAIQIDWEPSGLDEGVSPKKEKKDNVEKDEPEPEDELEPENTDEEEVKPRGRRKVVKKEEKPVVKKPAVKMTPCETCGKDIPEDAAKCEHCGQEFEMVSEGGEENDEVFDTESSGTKCSNCEKTVPEGKKRCPFCKEKVS